MINLSLIVAMDKNCLIGNGDRLPWSIKEELALFKEITIGNRVIMGRKTYESIGKPLPDRENIVLSKKNSSDIYREKVIICKNIDELEKKIDNKKENFIIGGTEIYKQFINRCDKLYISEVLGEYSGDKYFPELNYNDFVKIKEEKYNQFIFKVYKRINP